MTLAGIVLAAGEGRRLRPLTDLRPKPLCPVGAGTPLDDALARLAAAGLAGPDLVAVNAHHLADQIVAATAGRAHVSVERPEALGTAGAIGALAGWLDGRAAVIANGDAYLAGEDPLGRLLDGWSGDRPRLLTVRDPARGDFGDLRFAGISLLPAAIAARLESVPTGLYEVVWRDTQVELVEFDGTFVDCGTPREYLAANLHASGGASVVGRDAVVEGTLTRSVVWPGGRVGPDEHLVDAVRTDTGLTVPA
ncbi:MAG TPA: sugar phosphate nucleotidyltransferase [Mycobacteriales bacterium]|nr:sugar phosphate nucleotidyltransferase [Mycobacteriales bacterium]